MKKSFVLAFSLALTTHIASAIDPMPLQDFCVASDEPKYVFVNGKFCKDPKCVVAEDCFTWGLDILPSTDNAVGSNVTDVNVDRLPGLNTLGVSVARFDYATYGVNEPHINPRASEMLVVQEGTLYVGFVASNREGNRLFAKVLKKGDVFVVPIGLPHFQMNIGKTPAVAYAAFNSQNPVDVPIPKTLIGSDPLIDPEVLPRAFQLDEEVVEYLQARFQDRNSFP